MNKELANAMKERIKDLSFIDKLAGLVKTIETTTKDDQPKTIKFPASVDVQDASLKPWNYSDLVPNSNKKSIIYFEGRGLKLGAITHKGIQAEATIRLVCWMNDKFGAGSDIAATAQIIKRMIPANPFNTGHLQGITIQPAAFLDSEENLFGKYTYDEKILQYLMLPFHAFAIDFKVNFSVSLNCFPEDGN